MTTSPYKVGDRVLYGDHRNRPAYHSAIVRQKWWDAIQRLDGSYYVPTMPHTELAELLVGTENIHVEEEPHDAD